MIPHPTTYIHQLPISNRILYRVTARLKSKSIPHSFLPSDIYPIIRRSQLPIPSEIPEPIRRYEVAPDCIVPVQYLRDFSGIGSQECRDCDEAVCRPIHRRLPRNVREEIQLSEGRREIF